MSCRSEEFIPSRDDRIGGSTRWRCLSTSDCSILPSRVTRHADMSFGCRLCLEGLLQHFCQPRLPFGYPRGIVVSNHMLGISEQLGHISYGDAGPFQQYPLEGVSKRSGVGLSFHGPHKDHSLISSRLHTSVMTFMSDVLCSPKIYGPNNRR